MDVNIKLLELIHVVSSATNERYALKEMLLRLLEIFDLDQAAICVLDGEDFHVKFAIDRTKRIIPNGKGLWISKNIINDSLTNMNPQSFQEQISDESMYTRSIHEYSLKNILCIPIDHSSKTVVYLASQRRPNAIFSEKDLNNAMIASQASGLALKQFQNIQELKDQNNTLKKTLNTKNAGFLYSSERIEKLMAEVSKIAPFNISTFIYGESGTGKEELAKKIHNLSKRKGPFVAINCATLTETLLESELFGYVKGAFTGAIKDKKGLFFEANEGTLFLDEIAEIPLNLQSKLLRAIQERSIRPLGGNRPIPIDIRIISASLKNLELSVKRGEFREDLFYRINEISFTIPALRERDADIELLAKKFISDFCIEFNLKDKHLSQEALEWLTSYPFPGNVRELRNICRTSVILSSQNIIHKDDMRIPKKEVCSTNLLVIDNIKKERDLQTQKKERVKIESYEGPFQDYDLEGKTLKDIRKDYDKILINTLMKNKKMTQEAVAGQLGVSVRTIQRLIQ